MHFSAVPRAREDGPLLLKQWIESLLPDGSWNTMAYSHQPQLEVCTQGVRLSVI